MKFDQLRTIADNKRIQTDARRINSYNKKMNAKSCKSFSAASEYIIINHDFLFTNRLHSYRNIIKHYIYS